MATNAIVEIKLTEWAEGLARLRAELARILRKEADADADPRVTRKLREIATRFEVGQ